MENGCESHPKLLNISVCELYLDSVVVCCISLKRCCVFLWVFAFDLLIVVVRMFLLGFVMFAVFVVWCD